MAKDSSKKPAQASPPLSRGLLPPLAEGDVALLIDWENLKWSLKQHFDTTPNISSLVAATREHGRLVTARAYADWTLPKLSVDAPNLYRAGIDPIYVPGRYAQTDRPIKNSADVRLAVDAVDLCRQLPLVTTYVLVTGDSDLIHPLNYLRLNGRRVVIVAVEPSTSDLLSAAADAVMVYERDIEPLSRHPVPLATAKPAAPSVPPMQMAFGWVREILRENDDGQPYSFHALSQQLKQRYGFDARRWYRVPFKSFMLQAENTGLVHLSTVGSTDYAALQEQAEPLIDAAAPEEEALPIPASTAEVRLEALTPEEQRACLTLLRDLASSTPYMTAGYIVANMAYHSVLPALSREQLLPLVGDLVNRGILVRGQIAKKDAPGGRPRYLATLNFNSDSPTVREMEDSSAMPEAGVDPFAELLPALEEARRGATPVHFQALQRVLEARMGRRLRDLGYVRLSRFFQEAEASGLIRTARLASGGNVVLLPGEPVPGEAEARERPAAKPAVKQRRKRKVWVKQS